MREKQLNNILVNLDNVINEVLNNEQFSISYKLDLLIENQFITKRIKEMIFNEDIEQEIVYSFIKIILICIEKGNMWWTNLSFYQFKCL